MKIMNTKALVLCDDYWHPAKTPRAGLTQLAGKFADEAFDWMEDAREWPAQKINDYPLIILTKSNNISAADKTHWMSEDVQTALLNYVQRGGGLLAVHSGTAEYKETPVLRALQRRASSAPCRVRVRRGAAASDLAWWPVRSRAACRIGADVGPRRRW